MCLYYARQTKKSKDMATTIKTSSKNYFNKIQKYLNNKRVFFTPSLNLGIYALTIFDLNSVETTSLLNKMTKHFHLYPNQQEPMALAAWNYIFYGIVLWNNPFFVTLPWI